MPSWNIHLESGEKLAQKLHFENKKKREFLVGCLLPDINNGYVNSPKYTYPHHDTHYAFDEKSSLNFYADYSKKIREKDPIFLGFLFHLFLDGYFNYDFYHKAKHSSLLQNLNEDQKRDIKHHDFWLYDTNFRHALDLRPEEIPEIVSIASQIKNVNVTPEDLIEVDHILKDNHLNDGIIGESYIFYTKASLDELLKNALDEFWYQYFEADLPGLNHQKEGKNAWTPRSWDY